MFTYKEHFEEWLSKLFVRLPSGKWCKINGEACYGFICPPNVSPVVEWKRRYPTAYKTEYNRFIDEIHPY